MLTDVALKALKPKEKIYKIADRDGMYVRASCPVARSRFAWITGSTAAGRPSIWAGKDATESRSPGPERSASTRGAPLAKDGRRR
jgi:hypothetical protein